jgi:hypothetical protein
MSEPGFASLGPTLLARKGGAKPAMRPQLAPLVADEAEVAALADEQLEDLGWNDMGDGESENGAEVVPINAAVAAADPAAAHSPIVHRQQRRLEERVLADAVMSGPEDEAEDTIDEHAEEAGEGDDFDYEAWTADESNEADQEEFEQGYEPSYGDNFDDVDYAALAPAPVVAPAPAKRRRTPRAPARLATRAPAKASAKATERRAAFTLRLDPERHLKLRLAATMQGVSAQVLLTEALDRLLAEFDDLDVIAAHLKRH